MNKKKCRKTLECDICPQVMKNFQAFEAHKKLYCQRQFEEHKCEMCLKIFLTSSILKKHVMNNICTEPKPWPKYGECGDSFENAIRLYNHKKSQQPKPNPCLVCLECGKLCIGSTELKFHLYTHSGFKPYPCEICNKEFKTPSNLQTHKASHMIESKFFCKLCYKSFKLKQTLKKHELLHLEFSKPYTCGTCGSSFRET